MRLLGNRLFASTSAVMFLDMMAFLGTLYLITLFLQDGLGLSALNAGLSTFPEALGFMLGAQLAARIYPRVGPRRMLTAGLVGVAAMTALLATAVAQFADDRAAAPTMRGPDPARHTAAGAHAASAGCHHPATVKHN